MKAFGYVSAKDIGHAVAALAEHGAKAKILAGGTDLLVELKHAVHDPQVIVDVSRLRELKTIAVAEDGLHIGALATHGDIMASPIIRDMFPALVDAAHSIGAVQTRNLGTLGGNLITCVPSMDSGPTLMALEASVTVANADGQRQMPLAELFVGPRKTSLKPGDLLVDIVIPKQNLNKPAGFEKFGLRKGQALALVNAAAAFFIDNGKFSAPRIALGAVAPVVIRAPKAEAYLEGRAIGPEAMAEAGRIAATQARPISDFRASADYRRDLIAVLVKRALVSAQARATATDKELVA
ncbi:MAG TPA: xanthine dehydrogenase family protein subunit M [Pseudolabrys sp.]|nr:xanthine dehydrogenase family protein subunit M [Pseudolabrys sp.]